MTTPLEQFKLHAHQGDRVRYVPHHAYGDPTHPDCEDGAISSFGRDNVRVRFDKHVGRFGWEDATPQACDPEDLRLLPLAKVDDLGG